MRICHTLKRTPEGCHRRSDGLQPDACPAVKAAVSNGEPAESPCVECPVKDRDACPDIDQLSQAALRFGAIYDHPAHEGYKDVILAAVSPPLSPSELLPFLLRRQTAWEELAEIAREEARERQRKELESARKA